MIGGGVESAPADGVAPARTAQEAPSRNCRRVGETFHQEIPRIVVSRASAR